MKKLQTLLFALLFAAAVATTSCTDAEMAQYGGLGNKFKVELVNCDGSVTRSWISSGKVLNQTNSDGHFFKDAQTGDLIEVTGTLIITQLD
jgi:hypothetical protein